MEARPLASLLYRVWKAAQPFRQHRFAIWHSFPYLDDYTEPVIARLAGARAWIYTKKNMGWRRSWYVRSLLARRVAAQNTYIMTRFLEKPALRGRGRLIPPSVDVSVYSPDVPRGWECGSGWASEPRRLWWPAWPNCCGSRATQR